MATVFEPMSAVPPITTIFMFSSEGEFVPRQALRISRPVHALAVWIITV
jgi:hypothetical protein